MVRIQLDVPEEEREQFAKQAEREGMALDAWLIAAARQRATNLSARPKDAPDRFESVEELMDFLEECRANSGLKPELDTDESTRGFASVDELEEFFRWCDSLQDGQREPDWEEHLRNIDASRREGLPDV